VEGLPVQRTAGSVTDPSSSSASSDAQADRSSSASSDAQADSQDGAGGDGGSSGATATAQAANAMSSSEASPFSVSTASAQQTQATAASGAAPLSASGVEMQDMIESIRATIEIAARQGATQARIALHPEDLGQISVHLSQTSQGLLARVSADTPAAAQALADGRSELRQSLSSLGLPLLRLDIGSSGQSGAGERQDRFAGSADGSNASTTPAASSDGERPETVGALDGAPAPTAIAGGGLVDVLA
jgi:flagellar hook-length control protein FliK